MNGVGLTTVGKLLGHRRRGTTAIYAHLDDTALQEAADIGGRGASAMTGPRIPGAIAAGESGAPSPAVTATEESARPHRRWELPGILRQKR